MRVIGGEFRSRRLKALPGTTTRPTPDRLRETLFDIIGGSIPGSVFLDAYAGSGAVGIEALSRGAARAIFIERNRAAANVVRDNLQALGLQSRAEVVTGKVTTAIGRFTADIVFLDPPYELASEYSSVMSLLAESAPPLVIAQHDVRTRIGETYGNLERFRTVRQGDNVLSFYRP